MAAEHHAAQAGVGRLQGGHLEAELEPGPPPRHPRHLAPEAALGERGPVGGGGERDHGVGVEVVDVGLVDERVHGGVDRRGRAAGPEAAVVEQLDLVVLVVGPAVAAPRAPGPGPGRAWPARRARGCRGRRRSPSRAGPRRAPRSPGPRPSPLAEVLPPPKFVTVGSAPSARDRREQLLHHVRHVPMMCEHHRSHNSSHGPGEAMGSGQGSRRQWVPDAELIASCGGLWNLLPRVEVGDGTGCEVDAADPVRCGGAVVELGVSDHDHLTAPSDRGTYAVVAVRVADRERLVGASHVDAGLGAARRGSLPRRSRNPGSRRQTLPPQPRRH